MNARARLLMLAVSALAGTAVSCSDSGQAALQFDAVGTDAAVREDAAAKTHVLPGSVRSSGHDVAGDDAGTRARDAGSARSSTTPPDAASPAASGGAGSAGAAGKSSNAASMKTEGKAASSTGGRSGSSGAGAGGARNQDSAAGKAGSVTKATEAGRGAAGSTAVPEAPEEPEAGAGGSGGSAGNSRPLSWFCVQVGESCSCLLQSTAPGTDLCQQPRPTCCYTLPSQGLENCQCWPEDSAECEQGDADAGAARIEQCPPAS